MKLVTDTPLRAGWRPWCFAPGEWRLVVAVKATLELPPEGVARLAEEQDFLRGDEPWDDDPDRSLRYAEDLALLKPRAEVWVSGTLTSAEPTPHLACQARVGDVEMRFDVLGDRWWRPDGGQTPPSPFTQMPLCWERCFGGPGFARNPVGRGLHPDPADPEGRIALPNIEQHEGLMRSPRDRPEPAGAWPIPQSWQERAGLLGRDYGPAYVRERWPYFAADFRWAYFQAARSPQQLDGFWRGDEAIELTYLHPEHARIACGLPGIRASVFVLENASPRGPLREVPMALDTVAIDVGEGKAFLVWRGSTPCAGESLEELGYLYVTHERLDDAASPEQMYAAFVRRLRAMWEEEHALEPEEPPPSESSESDAAVAEPPPAVSEASSPSGGEAPIEAAVTSASLLEAARQKAREQGWPEEVIAQLYPTEPLAPSFTEAERRAALLCARSAAEELGLADVASVLTHALEAPAPVAGGDEAAKPSAPEPPPGLWDPQQLREQVLARLEQGQSLARLSLSGADLSLLDLRGQDLSGAVLLRADLTGATLDGATLDGATLDGAKLEGATLRGTSLREASLSLADADGVDFTEANLEYAVAERAMLFGARFDRVQGAGLTLEECLATGASFRHAQLRQSEFAHTNLDEADFRHADLTDARLMGSSLRLAAMDLVTAPRLRASDQTDLSEASLRYCCLNEASFARSILIGTKFVESDLRRAVFAEARLEGANMLAVDAASALFSGAILQAATLAGANLLRARFEGAAMQGADLSSANLYGAELWKAAFEGARFDGAMIQETKLA